MLNMSKQLEEAKDLLEEKVKELQADPNPEYLREALRCLEGDAQYDRNLPPHQVAAEILEDLGKLGQYEAFLNDLSEMSEEQRRENDLGNLLAPYQPATRD